MIPQSLKTLLTMEQACKVKLTQSCIQCKDMHSKLDLSKSTKEQQDKAFHDFVHRHVTLCMLQCVENIKKCTKCQVLFHDTLENENKNPSYVQCVQWMLLCYHHDAHSCTCRIASTAISLPSNLGIKEIKHTQGSTVTTTTPFFKASRPATIHVNEMENSQHPKHPKPLIETTFLNQKKQDNP